MRGGGEGQQHAWVGKVGRSRTMKATVVGLTKNGSAFLFLSVCVSGWWCGMLQLRALSREGLGVSNFAVPQVSEASKRRLARVMQLRALELRDIRRSGKRGEQHHPALPPTSAAATAAAAAAVLES